MRKRLCMVVHGPYPLGEPRVVREASVAQAAGFDVDVVAMQRGDEAATELIEGVRVIRLPLRHVRGRGLGGVIAEYTMFTLMAVLVVARRHMRRRYNVVHIHNPPDFLVVSAIFPKFLGAKVIFDVHDLSPDMFAMRFGEGRAAKGADAALRRLERVATRVADHVITVHDPYRHELTKRRVPPAKITVVMNSLDERLLPARGRTEDSAFRVVYHGTVTPPYGVLTLVEAAPNVLAAVATARFEIYGEGDALTTAMLRAAELGVADAFFFSQQYLPHAEVLERVAGASAGVIPNLATRLNKFALSSKLFEYVALGIPVVSSDLPTIRAHFNEHELLYVPPGDASALAAAVVAIAQDRRAAAARAAAAAARYADYRWSRQRERYEAVLATLTDRRCAV